MSDWSERQIVRAVRMALEGETAGAIAEAIGKEPWAVRNRLAQHDICVLHTGGRLHRVVAVKISARAHDAFGAEAGRRGFDLCGLFAHMAEIAAADRLFDAILGDHRGVGA